MFTNKIIIRAIISFNKRYSTKTYKNLRLEVRGKKSPIEKISVQIKQNSNKKMR